MEPKESSENATWEPTATQKFLTIPKKHLPPDPWDFMVLDVSETDGWHYLIKFHGKLDSV
jgi:hypothetical protein